MHPVLQSLRRLATGLVTPLELPAPETEARRRRLLAVERNIVLPSKVALTVLLFYALGDTPWFGLPLGSLEVTITTLRALLLVYTGINLAGAGVLCAAGRLPFPVVQWTVFATSLVDALLVGGLVLLGGGTESLLFWVFPLLIVRNAAANPPIWSQLALNLCVAACFGAAGWLDIGLTRQVEEEIEATARPLRLPRADPNLVPLPPGAWNDGVLDLADANPVEDVVLRLAVLVLVSVWLFAVQVLFEKQRLAARETAEFRRREGELRSAGRLAAEFAHQIKNPLAIINNAVFSLRRSLQTGKGDPQKQLAIIAEEVSRADDIIREIMGYGELTDSHVERLDLRAEIERARARAFPEDLGLAVRFQFKPRGPLPPLVMQRRHLNEILVNLFQNAREAMPGGGTVTVTAQQRRDGAVEVVVADDGPGIAPARLARIFESYYTTKQRGTGLGLAIVKNNTELYGGSVRAESELGKGARFTLVFPPTAASTPGA